jgi:phosphatidylserine/phosphatidylglycerophosphate/cardiolipin synthase-like enzyme
MVEVSVLSEATRIITSLDGPFAISDAIRQAITETRQRLLIAAPWFSKGFFDLLRNLALRGITINIVAKLPEKSDYRTFYALESVLDTANAEGWTVKVKFNPYLHAKVVIVDDKTCLLGSFNPTDSGIYYNDEALILLNQAAHVEQMVNFFQKLWERSENTSFQQVRIFYGCQTAEEPYRKKIAEKVIGLFVENGNNKIPKWKVCKEVMKFGYSESDVISVLRDLVNNGVLYEPGDFYRMADG